MERQRKTDENLRDYKVRLAEDKTVLGLNWQEVADLINYETGETYGESAHRKELQSMLRGIDFEKERHLGREDNDLVNEIDEKTREMKKERVKLSDANREYNKIVREESRGELFEDMVVQSIQDNLKPLSMPDVIRLEDDNDKEGVLLISDAHYGKDIVIKSPTGEVINEYNIEVFESRMWKLFDETLKIIHKENLKKLNIFNLADSIEGIIRFKKTLPETGILTAIMEYTNFMHNWINKLSAHVTIEYYQNLGNHSSWRILDSANHKDTFPQENAERIIVWSLRTMLKDNPNVILHDEQIRGLVYTEILGFNFMASHGDKTGKIENVIKEYESLYDINIDYFLLGHKHFNFSSMTTAIGKEVIQCVSLMGVDEYAIELKKSSEAGSRLLIIEEEVGKTTDYYIRLN